jgi:hypothetical protein
MPAHCLTEHGGAVSGPPTSAIAAAFLALACCFDLSRSYRYSGTTLCSQQENNFMPLIFYLSSHYNKALPSCAAQCVSC